MLIDQRNVLIQWQRHKKINLMVLVPFGKGIKNENLLFLKNKLQSGLWERWFFPFLYFMYCMSSTISSIFLEMVPQVRWTAAPASSLPLLGARRVPSSNELKQLKCGTQLWPPFQSTKWSSEAEPTKKFKTAKVGTFWPLILFLRYKQLGIHSVLKFTELFHEWNLTEERRKEKLQDNLSKLSILLFPTEPLCPLQVSHKLR